MTRLGRVALRRIVLCFVAAIVLASVGGCWDRRELDESLHVLSAFLDLEPDGMIRLTVEVLSLGGGGGQTAQQSTHVVLTAVGGSFEEAAWNARWQVQSPLNFAHAGAVVLGEELARSGIADVVDSLAQSYEVRRRTLMAVVKGKAADLLSAARTASRHSEQITGLIEAESVGASGVGSFTLNEVIRSLSGEGKDVVLARFVLQPPPPVKHVIEHAQGGGGAAGDSGGGEAGDSGGAQGEEPPVMKLDGAAVFGGDGRLAGFLEEREAAALQLIIGSARARILRVPTDTASARNGFTLRTATSSARYEAAQAGSRLTLGVRVHVEADLLELETGGDMASPADIAHIEQLAAQHLEALILDTLTHCASDIGADPAGLGRFLSRWHPRLWDQYRDRWPETLADAEIRTEVKVSIVNTGMLLRKARGPDQVPPPGGGN